MAKKDGSAGLVVVGAGPGGYAAAFLAADLGMEVTLVDPEANPGGVCLYRGCIPSKALLHAAKVVTDARDAAAWGLRFAAPTVDLAALRGWKDNVVARLTGGLGTLSARRKIAYVRGRGRFRDAHTLEIEPAEGGARTLAFEHAIVATGSLPAPLPGVALASPLLMDSTGALALADVPGRLLVVGGGYIGLELGVVYAALGSRVTVVEMMAGLLPGVDADLVRPLAARVERLFEAVRLRTRVAGIAEKGGRLRVEFDGETGGGREDTFDRVLVAVGRRPNAGTLGLERTNAEVDDWGFIVVDAQRRSREPSIFAIGDVAGEPMLAHKASHEGRAAVEVIAGRVVAFDPQAIPAVVFTDPEIAWCGLTEDDAKRRGRAVTVTRFPWAASGRALTLDRPEGLTKLVLDPDSGRVLGVGLAGPGAGELIAEGVLAIEMGATATDLALSIHPHPTLSETIMEAGEMYLGQSTHVHRPPRPAAAGARARS
jgi:dihydrolipoamide dehydrogenase